MKMSRPQFRLRSLFILTAIVAVGCLVGPPIIREVRETFWPPKRPFTPARIYHQSGRQGFSLKPFPRGPGRPEIVRQQRE